MPRKLLILWIPKRNWNEKLTENIQIQHLRADQCEKNISFHTHLEVGTFWVMYTLRTIYSGKFIALFVVRQELQPWSESVMHQPIPLVPFHQELWGIWSRFRRLGRGKGGGGLLIFCYYTRRPGICLDPGHATLWPWIDTRMISIPHVESVWIYGNVNVRSSLHECQWYAERVRDFHEYGVQYFTCVLRQQVNFKLWNKNVYQKLERFQMQWDKMAIFIWKYWK